ncbi:hypothetical protein GCM10009624_17520 [Gordonia sinesedis]
MSYDLAFDSLRVDDTVTDWVVSNRGEPLTSIVEALSHLGDTITLTALTVIVTLGYLIRRHVPEAVLLGLGALLGTLVMTGLKNLIGRQRPLRPDRLLEIESYSFPSGHAMMTMVVFGLVAVTAYRLSPWVREHRWILLLAPLLSIVVGVTRVYLAVHWTTDVVAGWMFGALWVTLCVYIFRRVMSSRAPTDPPGGREHVAAGSE